MRKGYKYILAVVILLIISNLYSRIRIGKQYHYSTQSGDFEIISVPGKGSGLEHVEFMFAEYKNENPEYSNSMLYRKHKMELWRFWLWSEYCMYDGWKYPYLKKEKYFRELN